MIDERRAVPRVTCILPVRLYPQDTVVVIQTLTRDLGAHGTQVVTTQPIPNDAPVSIELCLEPGEAPLTLLGRAVWHRAIPNSQQFHQGVAFSTLSEHITRLMSGYIRKIQERTIQSV